MTRPINPITITLDRHLLENPEAVHVRRMRGAIWLYLVLLSRLPADGDTIDVDPVELSRAMGLPEGTIRSWLGHLKKGRYIGLERVNGTRRVRIEGSSFLKVNVGRPRFFTVGRLSRALGERRDDEALERAIASHTDDALRRALAGALAVPREKIRRSRTALFLYLLTHDHEQTT